MFPPSTEGPVTHASMRVEQTQSVPGSGGAPTGEIGGTQNASVVVSSPQDEVKMQMDSPGEIAVYQFVNQHGSLILQVPSQQLLSLARQISQELAQEAAPKEPVSQEE